MKKVILISAIAIALLSSCSKSKTYTYKTSTGFEYQTDINYGSDSSKVGDKFIVFKYPGDIKHNEYLELTLISVKQ